MHGLVGKSNDGVTFGFHTPEPGSEVCVTNSWVKRTHTMQKQGWFTDDAAFLDRIIPESILTCRRCHLAAQLCAYSQ